MRKPNEIYHRELIISEENGQTTVVFPSYNYGPVEVTIKAPRITHHIKVCPGEGPLVRTFTTDTDETHEYKLYHYNKP
jgi:hypothetical protein